MIENEHYRRGLARLEHFNSERFRSNRIDRVDIYDIRTDIIDTQSNALRFVMPVDAPLLTGNELLYYPELTQALRGYSGYPFFERQYPLECAEEKGKPFLVGLAAELTKSLDEYEVAHRTISAEITSLIQRLIQRREAVRVEAVESNFVTISGMTYELCTNFYDGAKRDPFHISTHDLFGALKDRDCHYVTISDFIPGSPFVDVRFRKDYGYKGRPTWVNLETMQPASAAERQPAARKRA